MKIAFVVCNIDLVTYKQGGLMPRWESTYREGIASIAAVLRQAGHECSLLKFSAGVSEDKILRIWGENFLDYDMIGFTINTVDFREASRIANTLKATQPELVTICGGMHPTMSAEECIAEGSGFDIVCKGEGEDSMVELCDHLVNGTDYSELPGMWVRRGDEVFRNPTRSFADLDNLPPPARDMRVVADYSLHNVTDNTFFMATRGCPYKCTYCCNEALWDTFPEKSGFYRFKPIDKFISEIRDYLDANPGCHWVPMYDDLMMGNRKWFCEFAEAYEKHINKACFIAGRWETLDERTVPWVARMKCKFMLVGVEVGDEQMRRKLLKRNQSDKLMIERANLLRKYKVHFGTYTMVGIPHETFDMALKTVKLAARIGGNQMLGHHTIFFPFEGTPLYDVAKDEGLLSDRWVGSYFDDTKLNMPYFTREEIVYAHRNFVRFRTAYWLAFKLPRWLGKVAVRYLDHLWDEAGRRARRDAEDTERPMLMEPKPEATPTPPSPTLTALMAPDLVSLRSKRKATANRATAASLPMA